MEKFTLANGLTGFRLVGALGMVLLEPMSLPFYILYTLSGISDALDGPVARRSHTASDFGAKLDSVADLVFYTVMLLRLLPRLRQLVPVWIWTWVSLAVGARILVYLFVAVKLHRFASLHTWMNKLTGGMLFALPYMMPVPGFSWYCVAICAVASVSTLWEFTIHLRAKA